MSHLEATGLPWPAEDERWHRFGQVERLRFGEEAAPPAVGRALLVLAGEARVLAPGDPVLTSDELGPRGERTLLILRTGESFGELAAERDLRLRARGELLLLRLGEAPLPRGLAARLEDQARRRRAAYALADSATFSRLPRESQAELVTTLAPALCDRPAPAPPARRPPRLELIELAPTPEHPFASKEGHFLSGRPPVGRFHFIPQSDETDCAPACLAMVCRHFGKRLPRSRLRTLAGGSARGTSLRELCRAARELGLAARSAQVSREHMERMPLPAVLHWEGRHWVVLLALHGDRARLADPALGERWVGREELLTHWTGAAALFDLTAEFQAAEEPGLGLGWLVQLARPYSTLLGQALALALLVAGLSMLLPTVTQVVIDRAVVDRSPGLLGWVVGLLAVVFALAALARLLHGYLLSFVAVRLDTAILDLLVRRLLDLPPRYFAARRTGDLQRRLAAVREIRDLLMKLAVKGVASAVQLLVVGGLMLLYSPLLTLCFLGLSPLLGLIVHVATRWLTPLVRRLEEDRGRYQADQLEAIKGIESVKVLAAEPLVRERLLEQHLMTARSQFSADYARLAYEGLLHLAAGASQVLFLWVGAGQTMAGHLTVGGLVAFSLLVMLANEPVFSLLQLYEESRRGEVLVDRLADVFQAEPEQGRHRTHLAPVPALEGRVALEGVDFTYPASSQPVLSGVQLTVRPGERVAIVGRSGSGKSTLLKLLAGLAEPSRGRVLFDGRDLAELDHRELRQRIGFVLQDTYLFSGTVLENIAFGEELDLERAAWAAQAADAHDFIRELPAGYHTEIGETGHRLSGGQAQRLAIARALYRRPRVFVFDEATSALDTESERRIQANLGACFAGATVFIVAHRLSTVRDADRIVVLERGQIVEQGSHAALMSRRGLYHELVEKQEAA